jgi:orotate phosphoribosyltransferase
MIRQNLFTAAKTVAGISQQRELSGAAWRPPLKSGGKSPMFLDCRATYHGTPLADF